MASSPVLTNSAPAAQPVPDAVDRYFEISLFGLLATGFLTLAATGRMDLPTVLVMGLALLGRAALLWQKISFVLSPAWVRRLAVIAAVFFLADALYLEAGAANALERWLLATVHFLFFLAVVELFSATRTRDFVYLAALAFAQMLAAATLTIGTEFLFFFAIFLLFAIATFTSFEIRRARDRVTGIRPVIPSGGKRAGLGLALSGTALLICS